MVTSTSPTNTSKGVNSPMRVNHNLGQKSLSSADLTQAGLNNPVCRRQFKIDHLCQLNFDQGSKAGCLAPGCG